MVATNNHITGRSQTKLQFPNKEPTLENSKRCFIFRADIPDSHLSLSSPEWPPTLSEHWLTGHGVIEHAVGLWDVHSARQQQ